MSNNILQLTGREMNWTRDAVVEKRERLPDDSEHYDPGSIDETLAAAQEKLNDAIEARPVDEGLVALIQRGCSCPEAVDYYAVEHRGLSQSGWADERGVSQPTVSENVAKARAKLDGS